MPSYLKCAWCRVLKAEEALRRWLFRGERVEIERKAQIVKFELSKQSRKQKEAVHRLDEEVRSIERADNPFEELARRIHR